METELKLNLGCGLRKIEGFINIDNRECVNPDLCIDILDRLPFEDSTVDILRAFDFLEHIPIGKTLFVIEEIYRVLKQNGVFYHFTPSTDGRGAFQDPTHQSFWNINSWLYFMNHDYRNLYGIKAFFIGDNTDEITDKKLNIIHTRGVLYAVK